jgi:hypothetical protein
MIAAGGEEHQLAIHRQVCMMKSRTLLFISIGLLILGAAVFTYFTRNQPPSPSYPATVRRDCAPWDGAAFTLTISLNEGKTISVSIWQEPDLPLSRTFSFPDKTGQVGNASLFHTDALTESLSGTVSFSAVNPANPVEGHFDLKDENGNAFKGTFRAEWNDQTMLCG